jgi:hypothetical protein
VPLMAPSPREKPPRRCRFGNFVAAVFRAFNAHAQQLHILTMIYTLILRMGERTLGSNSEEKEVIMDNPALGRDSVIFESFSFISLDSIMDSIDSSQIPVLIGRSQRRRPEGAEEHPPRRLFPGWGSRGRAFNSGLAGQMARTRDADADQCAVGGEPAQDSKRHISP